MTRKIQFDLTTISNAGMFYSAGNSIFRSTKNQQIYAALWFAGNVMRNICIAL